MPADPPRICGKISRRALFSAGCGAIAAVGFVTDKAAAQPKVSKQVVAYQDHPEGTKRCDLCVQFEPPGGCKVVEGAISPDGSCRLFVQKRQQASAPG